MTITYEQVAAAAEQIVAAGGKVSSRSIRSILPCSPNELGPLLNDWKAGRTVIKAADIVLDPEISAVILRQVQTVIDKTRADTEERIKELEEEIQDTQTIGRENERRIVDVTGQLAQAHTDINQRDGQLAELHASITDMKEAVARETAAREKALKELGQAETKAAAVPGLEKQIIDLAAQLETERKARETAQIEVAGLRAERDAAKKDATAEAERVKALQSQLEAAQKQTESVRTTYDTRLKEAQAATDKIITAEHSAATQNAKLSAQLEAAAQVRESLEKTIQAFEVRLQNP
jgi:chromosome segregation ATPase